MARLIDLAIEEPSALDAAGAEADSKDRVLQNHEGERDTDSNIGLFSEALTCYP